MGNDFAFKVPDGFGPRNDAIVASRLCDGDTPLVGLPEQVLVMIVSRVRDVRPATAEADAEADARSLYADVMHGIGSVSRHLRRAC